MDTTLEKRLLCAIFSTTSGYHLWVPPLGTTYGYHLWVPLLGTTSGYHLREGICAIDMVITCSHGVVVMLGHCHCLNIVGMFGFGCIFDAMLR
jgi:hypothetical protein